MECFGIFSLKIQYVILFSFGLKMCKCDVWYCHTRCVWVHTTHLQCRNTALVKAAERWVFGDEICCQRKPCSSSPFTETGFHLAVGLLLEAWTEKQTWKWTASYHLNSIIRLMEIGKGLVLNSNARNESPMIQECV